MSILLWIQADSCWRLLKSTPWPPCSTCRHRGDVDAARLQSVGHTGRADIFTQIIICLFLHADILRYIVLQVCKTRYDGEYKLNYISLFNFPISHKKRKRNSKQNHKIERRKRIFSSKSLRLKSERKVNSFRNLTDWQYQPNQAFFSIKPFFT